MPCCVIAACLLIRIMMRGQAIGKYFGFRLRDDEERFGFVEHGELDVYGS